MTRLHASTDGSIDLDGYLERERLIAEQRRVLLDAINPDNGPTELATPDDVYPSSSTRQIAFNLLVQRDGPLCYLCLTALADVIEHIIPRHWGGTDDATNVALACSPCNVRKGSKYVSLSVTSGAPRYHWQRRSASGSLKEAAHPSTPQVSEQPAAPPGRLRRTRSQHDAIHRAPPRRPLRRQDHHRQQRGQGQADRRQHHHRHPQRPRSGDSEGVHELPRQAEDQRQGAAQQVRATFARILRRTADRLDPITINVTVHPYDPQAVADRVVAIIKAGGRK